MAGMERMSGMSVGERPGEGGTERLRFRVMWAENIWESPMHLEGCLGEMLPV